MHAERNGIQMEVGDVALMEWCDRPARAGVPCGMSDERLMGRFKSLYVDAIGR